MRLMPKPLRAASVVVGVLLTGAAAQVQAQANPGAGRDFGGQQQPPAAPPPQQAGFPPVGANVAGGAAPAAQQGNGTQSDFMETSLHDWVVASARTARSRAMLHLAEKQLTDAIRDVQFAFENSQEYKDAVAAEKKAYDQYNAERQRALKSVYDDPKYQAAVQLRDEMADRLVKVKAMAKPNPVPREDLLAMASAKLQYASDAHNMERDVLDKDAAVQDARQRMVEANARVTALRSGFDASIRTNSQVGQARRNLDQARIDLITAEAYYNASSVASAMATDYTYYRHRWDGLASPVVGGWGPYGYTGY